MLLFAAQAEAGSRCLILNGCCLFWKKSFNQFPATAVRDAAARMERRFIRYSASIITFFWEKITGRFENWIWGLRRAPGSAGNARICPVCPCARPEFGSRMRFKRFLRMLKDFGNSRVHNPPAGAGRSSSPVGTLRIPLGFCAKFRCEGFDVKFSCEVSM